MENYVRSAILRVWARMGLLETQYFWSETTRYSRGFNFGGKNIEKINWKK